MKPAVPLSEFMPYGAPELLEARQRHLSHALLLASATALVLYALTGGLASLTGGKTALRAPIEIGVILEPTPPPPLVNFAPRTPPQVPIQKRVPPLGEPMPVQDDPPPPPTQPQTSGPSDATGSDTSPPSTPAVAGSTGPPKEVLPAYGEWVPVEQLPEVVTPVKPTYPELPIQAGVEGLVMVHVLVGVDGRVRDARLDPKVHVPMLDQAALEAARRWVFTPGLEQGHPVACWTAIPFRFRLH